MGEKESLMPKPQLQPDYRQWLSKQDAARALDCSTKTIEQLVHRGQLQQAFWKRPETGVKIAVIHPGDVERLRKERNPAAAPFVMPPAEAPQSRLPARVLRGPLAELLRALAENSAKQPEVDLRHRVYLTIREASAYTGLPAAELRRLVRDGSLKIWPHGRWRVRRTDLEAL